MTAEPTDEDLMLGYRDGDAAAFEALYRRHRGPLYRFLAHQCGDGGGADEVFQETWMSVVRARSRYRVEASFRTWLYGIARNRMIDHFRRRRVRPVHADIDPADEAAPLPDPAPTPEERVATDQTGRRLIEALAALPAEQREAFLMREEAGLSLAEMAAATGLGAETMKSRLRYAVAKLRKALGEAT